MNPEAPTKNDVEHLRLLSVFHYVVGGLAALFALLPSVHLIMGIAMVTGQLSRLGFWLLETFPVFQRIG